MNGNEDCFGKLIYTHGSPFGNEGRKRSRAATERGETYTLATPGRVNPHRDNKSQEFRGANVDMW
jgi:hypothetical protein